MKEEYTWEEILSLERLDDFYPEQVCRLTGLIFETGREQANSFAIKKGLQLASARELDDFNDIEKATLYYNVANGWSYLHRLLHSINSNGFWEFETRESENEIINLRKAIAFASKINNSILAAQLYTNLANSFNHKGRFIEAIQYWHQALKIKPGFGMAVGNLGFGLFHYARILFDEGHRFVFCQFSYKFLIKASNSRLVYPEAKESFKEIAKIIENRYGQKNLISIQDLDGFSLGRSREEREYREWCIKNHLFLNPLNDFIHSNISGHDCLFLPTMTLSWKEPPFFHGLYNQIKQEFVSARYFYFQSLHQTSNHFSDKDNTQMDTLDYSIYSLSIERLKVAFRMCYSIFDKIAYLLNSYLGLGLDHRNITFRRIWYSNPKMKDSPLHPVITSSQNWPLRGLFWLSKDLIEDDTEFSKSILPEAQEIATIRNFMEHKSLKVIEFGETGIVESGRTYQITRLELEHKVFVSIQMVRSAIMTLSFVIHVEESKKEQKPSIPVPFLKFDDNFKR